jgi:FG-GAP-like repeat
MLVVLLLLVLVPSSAAALSFTQPAGSPYSTTQPPFIPDSGGILGGAAVGDFNGDGISDVAVVNATGLPVFSPGESVSILLGSPGGGLRIAQGSPVAIYSGGNQSAAEAIATGDFNADGKLDLAVVDAIHDTVVILLGDGTGSFHAAGAPIAFSGSGTTSMALGDFNGDGKMDIAIVNSSITVLLGDGSGSFTEAAGSPQAISGFPTAAVAGDFTGDGRSDLAVTKETGGVAVYLAGQGGELTEAPGSPLATGEQPAAITSADLNGDGKLDLVTANSQSDNVTVLMGDGAGHFTPSAGSPFAVPSASQNLGLPDSVAVGDFTCDGRPDLAVTNFNGSSNNVAILQGDGNGGFANVMGSPFPANINPGPVLVGDFNGDGQPDLAIVNRFLGAVSLLGNTGSCGSPQVPVAKVPSPPDGTPTAVSRASMTALLLSELVPPVGRAQIGRLLEARRFTLSVRALEPGKAVIDWYAPRREARHPRRMRATLIASGALSFSSAGSKTMTITLTRAGKQVLKDSTKVKVTARATFTPNGVPSIWAARTFLLVPRRPR